MNLHNINCREYVVAIFGNVSHCLRQSQLFSTRGSLDNFAMTGQKNQSSDRFRDICSDRDRIWPVNPGKSAS